MIVTKNTDVAARKIRTVEGLSTHGEISMKPLMVGDQMVLLEAHYPPGAGAPLHIHQHETVCYVVRGKVKVTVGEESFTLGPGDCCRHPKDVPHGIESIEDALVLEIKSPAQDISQFLGMSA